MNERWNLRTVDWTECSLIEVNPRKLSGVPIIKGTRVQADSIVENFESGSSVGEIAENFAIPEAAIREVLGFAEHRLMSDAKLRRAKIYYAANCYLDEWIGSDRQAMRTLTQGASESDRAVEELARIANLYAVARGFKTRAGVPRFEDVWNLLKSLRRPSTSGEAIQLVDEVIAKLKVDYDHELLSATTKFLWMRFQQPIVIYDSLAWKWISKRHDGRGMKTYEDFYRVWQQRFMEHRDLIGEACRELLTIPQFYRPSELASKEIVQALSSEWFAERVFDNFICDNN